MISILLTSSHTHTHLSVCVCVENITLECCGITMGQLAEECGVRVEVWLPHHKMAASGTTSPRMQQHPTRCRCLSTLMEGPFKTGGACCERASHESRKSQKGQKGQKGQK